MGWAWKFKAHMKKVEQLRGAKAKLNAKNGARGGEMKNARRSVTERKFWKRKWEGEQNIGRQQEKELSTLVFKNIRKSKERKKVVERGISMVLWEITLGTAYFLGLKRTYKLALRIQRRVVSPKYPKLRQFLHRFLPLFDSQCFSYSFLPVGNNRVLILFTQNCNNFVKDC